MKTSEVTRRVRRVYEDSKGEYVIVREDTTKQNMKLNIWANRVSDSKNIRLKGVRRTTGETIERTVSKLLSEAEGGVFGGDNRPVNDEMSVAELTDWHADYKWTQS